MLIIGFHQRSHIPTNLINKISGIKTRDYQSMTLTRNHKQNCVSNSIQIQMMIKAHYNPQLKKIKIKLIMQLVEN